MCSKLPKAYITTTEKLKTYLNRYHTYLNIYSMKVQTNYKLTRIEAKKLSDLKKEHIEPLRDVSLNYVEDNTIKLKPNVKRNWIKDITNSKTSGTLRNLETKYITALRFVKTKKPLPVTEVNRFNKSTNAAASKLQNL